MRTILSLGLSLALIFSLMPSAAAYWVWSPAEGKFVNPEGTTKRTAQEQYDFALQLHDEGEEDKMLGALKVLSEAYPRSIYAARAQYTIATVYEKRGDYSRASKAYQALIHDFPRSEHIDDAVDRLFRIGNLFLGSSKEKILGVAVIPVLPRAVEVFEFIVESAPYGPYGDQARFRLGIAKRKMGVGF